MSLKQVCFSLVVFLLSTTVVFAGSGDKFSITINGITSTFTEDTDGYYPINSKQELIAISLPDGAVTANVSNSPLSATGTANDSNTSVVAAVWALSYKLTADISFTAETLDGNGAISTVKAANDWNGDGQLTDDDKYGFKPLGKSNIYYAGSFNGNNHKIDNLYIYRTTTSYCGLIGRAGYSSAVASPAAVVVENVTLNNAIIYGEHSNGSVIAEMLDLAGASITIKNCFSYDVKVTGTTNKQGCLIGQINAHHSNSELVIENCGTSGSVYATANGDNSSRAGGLIGDCQVGVDSTEINSYLKVINCFANCNVSAHFAAGGLMGGIAVRNTNCALEIKNCYSKGRVSDDSAASESGSEFRGHGGLIGVLELARGGVSSTSITISGCYSSADVINSDNTEVYGTCKGGLIGIVTSGNATVSGESSYTGAGTLSITACYATGQVKSTSNVGGFIGGYYAYGTTVNSIQACYSTGAVTASSNYGGGIFGYGTVTSGSAFTCQGNYSTSAVAVTANNGGGIAGYLVSDSTVQAKIRYCYALNTSVSAAGNVNKVIGSLSGTGSAIALLNNFSLSDMSGGTFGVTTTGDSQNGQATTDINNTPLKAIKNTTNGIIALMNAVGDTTYWGAADTDGAFGTDYWATVAIGRLVLPAATIETEYITQTINSIVHPILIVQATPVLFSNSMSSGLSCLPGTKTTSKTFLSILSSSVSYPSINDSGSQYVYIKALPSTGGTWRTADGAAIAINTAYPASTEIYFEASSDADSGGHSGFQLYARYVASQSRPYDSYIYTSLSATVTGLSGSLSSTETLTTKSFDINAVEVPLYITNKAYADDSWKLVPKSAVTGFTIPTSYTSYTGIDGNSTAQASVSIAANTSSTTRTFSFDLVDANALVVNTYTLTQAGLGNVTGSFNQSSAVTTSTLANAATTLNLYINNSGGTDCSWKLVEDSAVTGFSITSGTVSATIAASGGTATATIAVTQNTSMSDSRTYSFKLYSTQSGSWQSVQSFTITQNKGLNITAPQSTDPVSGNTVGVGSDNESTVTVASSDITTYSETTDDDLRDTSGNAIDTVSIVLSDSSSAGESVRSATSSTDNIEVVIASLQDNGNLVVVTSDSAEENSANGATTASAVIIIDPNNIAVSETNVVSAALNNGTIVEITSLPTGVKPDYDSTASEITASSLEKLSIEQKITTTPSASSSSNTSTIELTMYLTQTVNSIDTTSVIEKPLFVGSTFSFRYKLSDLNIADNGSIRVVLSNSEGSYELYLKGVNTDNDAEHGYYELSSEYIIISVWHFSSVSISNSSGSGSGDASSSGSSCMISQNGSVFGILPIAISLMILLFISRRKANR